jgi:hypothetical protein
VEKRIRSPNYPALSLPDAIERVSVLYRNQHTHAAPREVVAKSMGFGALSGPAATAVSALQKYGFLERDGDGLKVSERALSILHPHSPTERAQALREAATQPSLFAELNERFPGTHPSEELLRNYLLRKGFSPSAVSTVVLSYRETSELVARDASGDDSLVSTLEGHGKMQMSASVLHHQIPTSEVAVVQGDERSLGRYDFEGGGFVRITAGGNIDTEAALEMAETLITLKRKEIARRPQTQGVSNQAPTESRKESDENA